MLGSNQRQTHQSILAVTNSPNCLARNTLIRYLPAEIRDSRPPVNNVQFLHDGKDEDQAAIDPAADTSQPRHDPGLPLLKIRNVVAWVTVTSNNFRARAGVALKNLS